LGVDVFFDRADGAFAALLSHFQHFLQSLPTSAEHAANTMPMDPEQPNSGVRRS